MLPVSLTAYPGSIADGLAICMGIRMDIWGVLFPRRCPVCDRVLKYGGEKICRKCVEKLIYIQEPRCKKCGKQILKFEEEYCYDCKKHKHLYKRGIVPFVHTGTIKKSIYGIKYKNKREYVDFYTDEIVRLYKEEIKTWKCDGIIPVPLYRKKQIKRGYNQAEIIAKGLSEKLGIPMYTDILKRVVNTKPQKELNDIQRKKNLENAFIISRNIVRLQKVILVDDIYTTGSTIDSCARVLMESGILEVYYVSLSIGTGY